MTMREILFRGKRVKPVALVSQWILGNYVFKADGSLPGLGKHFIVVHDGFGLSQWVEVDPTTVGQYTGLTDKNGKKIFEGDVVKRCFTLTRGPNKESRETQVGVVRYDNVTCGYLIRGACNFRRQWPGDTIEVIGNIHDNPELIGGESHG